MKKLLFSLLVSVFYFTSCDKEVYNTENEIETGLEERGISLGFGFEWAWLDQKFRLTSDGLKKVAKFEKQFGKKNSKVKSQMTTKDFEYFVHKAERRNPKLCPTSIYNNKGTAWKKYEPKICNLPSWCPDYTRSNNYK